MSFSIITIGKPGGGKSTANGVIQKELRAAIGLNPATMSDRLLLEASVLEDVRFDPVKHEGHTEKGPLEGQHSLLFDGNQPPGQRKFRVKDGIALNAIHREMIDAALTHQEFDGMVLEYAIGPDVPLPDEPINQSGDRLMEWFAQAREKGSNNVLVIEVDAPAELRFTRNGGRVDGIESATLRDYWPDGGELRERGEQLKDLGGDYVYIDNNHSDFSRFLRDIETVCEQKVLPLVVKERQ